MDATQLRLHAEMEERHWWFLGRRRIMIDLANRLVPPNEGKRVVDIGCGTGGNIASLAQAYVATGIDAEPIAIDLANARYPDVRFWCGQIEQMPREIDANTDLYLLMDVLEHVPEDFWFLSTLLARCRTGAHVMITVPAHERLWSSHDVALGHYRRYDKERLQWTWQDLPVAVRAMSYFNTRLYPAIRLVRGLGRYLRRSYGSAGTDLSLPPRPVNSLLTGWFAGEASVLAEVLAGGSRGYRTGASLLAILRVDGITAQRSKPANAPPDHPLLEEAKA